MKNFLQTLGAFTFEFLAFVLTPCPTWLRRKAAAWMGLAWRIASPSMREALEYNLQNLLGLQGADLERTSRQVFRNFAMTLHDFFFPQNISVQVPDKKKIEELRDQHKGILFLTFHMGHWEMGARVLRSWGWNVNAVFQPYRNRHFKRVIESRRAPGVHFIPVGGRAVAGVRAALKRGEVVAMLGDLPFGEEGIPVPLLNRRVLWPKGPILLAVREGTPIVVSVIVRTAPGSYRAVVEDPIIPRNQTREEVERLTEEVAAKFGKLVAQNSEQWYRFKKFDFKL